jgi:hypothetical protein
MKLAANSNINHIEIKSIRDSIEWNSWCVDQLVSKTIIEVTNVCREWASSKHDYLHKLIESRSISKNLINEVLQTLFAVDEMGQLLDQIAKALQSGFEEYDIVFPAIRQANLTLDSKRFEKYWFEVNRTSITSALMEEVKQYCWSMVLGDFQGWVLDQAFLDSGNRYSMQQGHLKALLFKQMDGVLLFVEQRISSHLHQEIIREIYRQYDQREERLMQSFHALHHADLLAEEILHQVS